MSLKIEGSKVTIETPAVNEHGEKTDAVSITDTEKDVSVIVPFPLMLWFMSEHVRRAKIRHIQEQDSFDILGIPVKGRST